MDDDKKTNRSFFCMVDDLYLCEVIPKVLQKMIIEKKIFEYKSKTLKTEYLIDIIHNIFLKYLVKNNNKFYINAVSYKKIYGMYYNYYIDYLVDCGILFLKKNYSYSNFSRLYSFNEKLLNSDVVSDHNCDKILLKKKRCKKINPSDFNPNNHIYDKIKIHLVKDLYNVTIDCDGAMKFIDNYKNDIVKYNMVTYLIKSIANGDIFYHFDDYGRFHTNFTILKSEVRKQFIRINGNSIIEFDIKNCQPLLFNKILLKIKDTIDDKELKRYQKLTKNGKLYDIFMSNKNEIYNRKDAKKIVYKALFGDNNIKNNENTLFRKEFPTIFDTMKKYKNDIGDYKIISHELQSMESDLIFNKIIKEIYAKNNKISLFTIHDSIDVEKIYADEVREIFDRNIKKELSIIYDNEK